MEIKQHACNSLAQTTEGAVEFLVGVVSLTLWRRLPVPQSFVTSLPFLKLALQGNE